MLCNNYINGHLGVVLRLKSRKSLIKSIRQWRKVVSDNCVRMRKNHFLIGNVSDNLLEKVVTVCTICCMICVQKSCKWESFN